MSILTRCKQLIVFYDFEVFYSDWLAVLIDQDGKETRIHNDVDAIADYVDSHAGHVWTGYNSLNYDRWILAGILSGCKPQEVKQLNDALIHGDGKTPWQRCKNARIKLYNTINSRLNAVPQYDAIYKVNNISRSLKTCEGHAGLSIYETGVSFDIGRTLTPEEVEETFEYCAYDVLQTIAVFKECTHAEFDTKMYFITKYDLPLTCISDTLGALVDRLLQGTSAGKGLNDAGRATLPKVLQLSKYKHLQDLRESDAGREVDENGNFKLTICEDIAGIPHVLGSGGIHGAPDGIMRYEGLILSYDITACYPSMMEHYGIARRSIGRWDRFLEIHRANIEFKHSGNKAARMPYKILDNSISGRLKADFSALYDPRSNNEICQGGIFLLLDLIEHIETGAAGIVRLIQSNTDGVFYALLQPDKIETVRAIAAEWQERTGLILDESIFNGVFHQKDVNNYLVADKGGKILKAKGADLKALSTYDYNLAIINKGLTAYLINKTLPEETVKNCTDLRDYQLIAHVSSGDALRHGGEILPFRTVRAFAAMDVTAGALEKVRGEKVSKYPYSPEHVFLENGDISGREIPAGLNKEWYISRIYEKIIAWTGEVLREQDEGTKAAKAAAKATAGEAPAQKPKGKKITASPTDPIALLDLKFQKKLFDDYAPEEVAAGVLRRLVDEYLTPNGLSLKGAKWARQREDVWTLRIKNHGDDRAHERGLILDIHLDGGKNACLQDFRKIDERTNKAAIVWKWRMCKDPEYKSSQAEREIAMFEPITDAEIAAMKQNYAEKQAAKAAAEEETRNNRETMIQDYKYGRPLASMAAGAHEYGVQYLKAKNVFEYAQQVDPTLKIHATKGTLIVPYYTAKGELHAAQQIGTCGYKSWCYGTYPDGLSAHPIKGKSKTMVAICEGLATGLSVHRRYKGLITVLVAGDANNLQAFGADFARRHKNIKVIIAADNDTESERKTGTNKGMETAKAVKAAAPDNVTIVYVDAEKE